MRQVWDKQMRLAREEDISLGQDGVHLAGSEVSPRSNVSPSSPGPNKPYKVMEKVWGHQGHGYAENLKCLVQLPLGL